ncbi:MAG: T9SS type A sorting domain-containing protein [Brumimicrobium sp.]|nr:T9SS type A sorting domain-containing protein [Brumimicrobium sp.]MCO5269535.1 M43 family zinc metalloprotease [Brumimicrobium sp.]
MKIILFIICTFLSGISIAQQNETDIKRCGTTDYIEYQNQKTPGYKEMVDVQFNIAKNAIKDKSNDTYVIPVVVHIVYKTAAQNLPDSVIYDQIRVLNEDYARLNADSINLRDDFLPHVGRGNIQFVLAGLDPDGNPTDGITRTQSNENFGSLTDISVSEKVKSSSTGGIDPWDQNRYLNIWVCDMSIFNIPMVLGYATPPSGLPNWPPGSTSGMSDGVVIQYQAFGTNNPNPLSAMGTTLVVKGRTPVHEVGHYLGLRHIWADGDCTQEDGIDDTPNASNQSQGCTKTANTCVDNIDGVDLPDMLENYMDYSSEDCQNTFTKGQVELMRGVLENQRYDLVHDNPASLQNNERLIASLFPNPAINQLNIQLNSPIKEIELFNLQGQALELKVSIMNDAAQINVSTLNNGVYMLKITNSKGQTTTKRFIKQ